MSDCHRCGYPDLATVHHHDGHAYGPECIEIVRGTRPDALAVMRAGTAEIKVRRAHCDRCDTHLTMRATKAEHRELLRRHRLSCR